MIRQIINSYPERHASRLEMELSGAQWTSRFHGSTALADLRAPFRAKAEAFIAALRRAGASVNITAAYRPAQRAYLMHWSWLIVKRDVDPATVPAMAGVATKWLHPKGRRTILGDSQTSRLIQGPERVASRLLQACTKLPNRPGMTTERMEWG